MDFCLDLKAGEFCSLVGESGSGKTTLALLLSGIIGSDSGEISFDGIAVTPKRRKKDKLFCAAVQLVLQNGKTALDPKMDVYSCIAEPIRNLRRLSRMDERYVVRELTEQMELSEKILTQKTWELSGGQQKRVCIARALAADPRVVIFDEAVSGLDMSVRKSVLDMLKKVHKNSGTTFLLITHDVDAALYTSQRIAVMRNGKILEDTDYDGDLTVFRNKYTRRLLCASLPESIVCNSSL